MGLSAPGVGSNLDVNGLVTSLMTAERQPLVISQQREAKVQSQLSAYGLLQSQIASFGDSVATLGKPESLAAYSASIDDPSVASIATSTAAVAGNYSLEVTQLAKAGKLATGPFAGTTSTLPSGSITISLGTYDSGVNSFTARTDKTPLTINIDSSNNTLGGLRDAVNKANAGVSATIVTDTNGARLVISSTDTGSKNALKIDAPGIAQLAFDPTAIGTQSVSRLQTAQDAKLSIDNLNIVSASNQVTGVIDGLTLALTKTNIGQPTTLHVAQDASVTAQALRNFVASYNGLNSLMRSELSYDPATKNSGPLQGQATAVSALSQLRGVVSGSIPGASGDFTRLSDIGISLQSDGSLKLDEVKLSMATVNGTSKLTRLFSSSAPGADTYVSRIKAYVDKTQGTGGTLTAKSAGLNSSIVRFNKDQVALNARLVTIEAAYRRQFNALDTQLSAQTALSSYITNQTTIWNNTASGK
jgi:flagellar hook-associated protein 2